MYGSKNSGEWLFLKRSRAFAQVSTEINAIDSERDPI